MLFAMVCSLTTAMTSCSSNDDDTPQTGQLSEGDKYLQKVLAANVDNTINPTYKALADGCEKLNNELEALTPGSITQQQVDNVCKTFLEARANYEGSEAFLLGAASHFLIDHTSIHGLSVLMSFTITSKLTTNTRLPTKVFSASMVLNSSSSATVNHAKQLN